MSDMINDISVFGTEVTIVAVPTYPVGITLTQFADDVAPITLEDMQISDDAMGANGDMISWKQPLPIRPTLGMIPGSDDDKKLRVLFDLNRVEKGKVVQNDVITMTIRYSNGTSKTLSGGQCRQYKPGYGQGTSGRMESSQYTFSFAKISA